MTKSTNDPQGHSDPVTVIHHVGSPGNVKVVTLRAPHLSTSMPAGGIHVNLHDHADQPRTGFAMFTAGGIVALSGTALAQYTQLTQPTDKGDQR